MRKILQRKSFAILIVSLSLSYCGKHKKEDPAAETKTSAPLALLSDQQDPKPTEDPEKKKEEEKKQEPEQTQPEAPKPLVRGMTPYDVVQTTPNYGNNNQVQNSFVDVEVKETKDTKKDNTVAVEKKPTTTSTLIANPFHSNKFMGEAYSAVGNQAMIDLINSDQIEKTQLEEILTNYFTLLESKDVSQYPLKQRLLDNLNLFSSNTTYANAMSKRISIDGMGNILDESELQIYKPLAYNTELLRYVTGYPKKENAIGAYFQINEANEQEHTAVYIGTLSFADSQRTALTEEEKNNLDQIALLLQTYFESPKQFQEKISIQRHLKSAMDSQREPTSLVYSYLQTKWPDVVAKTRDVSDSFFDNAAEHVNGQIEILIENKTTDYGKTMLMPLGNSGFQEVTNPDAGKRKFQKQQKLTDEEKEAQEAADKKAKKEEAKKIKEEADKKTKEDKTKKSEVEKIKKDEEEKKKIADENTSNTDLKKEEIEKITENNKIAADTTNVTPTIMANDSLPSITLPADSAKVEDEELNLNASPLEFLWDDEPKTENDSIPTETNFIENFLDQMLRIPPAQKEEEKKPEEIQFFANPFNKDDSALSTLRSAFYAYEATHSDFEVLELINILETDEISTIEQQKVVDTYLRIMKDQEPEFKQEMPLTERLTRTVDLYYQVPAFRQAIQKNVENQLYDIENKNGFKLTESELNLVVPLLYGFKLNRELSTDRAQKEISSQDELDVYETIDSKTKKKYRVIRLARFDFSEDKTSLSAQEKTVVKNIQLVWTAVQDSKSNIVWTDLHPTIVGYSNKNIISLSNESQQKEQIEAMAQNVKKALPKNMWFDIVSKGSNLPLPGTNPSEKINRRVEIVLVQSEVKN